MGNGGGIVADVGLVVALQTSSARALLWVVVGAAPNARALSKGYKVVPILQYTDRSPRAWATHKHGAFVGLAQKQCAGRRGGFSPQ